MAATFITCIAGGLWSIFSYFSSNYASAKEVDILYKEMAMIQREARATRRILCVLAIEISTKDSRKVIEKACLEND